MGKYRILDENRVRGDYVIWQVGEDDPVFTAMMTHKD